MAGDATPPRGNPFATRFVRPGAIEFLFDQGASAEGLIAAFERCGCRGAIVGPHGTGKSTLLAALLDRLATQSAEEFASHHLETAARMPAVVYRLHDGQRRLPREPALGKLAPGTLIVVDGYEQLSAWSRLALRWTTARRRLGLLVTSHSPTYLPTLYTTSISLDLADRIAAQLQSAGAGEDEARLLSRDDVATALAAHPTNLRECLFALYDLYEQRASEKPPATPDPAALKTPGDR
jgi:hypothetical protein